MTLREQVRYLFWEQAGWGRLSRGGGALGGGLFRPVAHCGGCAGRGARVGATGGGGELPERGADGAEDRPAGRRLIIDNCYAGHACRGE